MSKIELFTCRVRLTKDEYNILDTMCKEAEMSKSAFIRELILEKGKACCLTGEKIKKSNK